MTTALEQSLIDLCAGYDLTAVSIGINLKQREGARFDAIVHWDGFSASGHRCAIENGATIGEALRKAITKAQNERRTLVAIELADEAVQVAA